MHAGIFAMAVGTPALAVAYEPKVRGVMTLAGLGDRVLDASTALRVDDVMRLVEVSRDPAQRVRTRDAFERMRQRLDTLPGILAGHGIE